MLGPGLDSARLVAIAIAHGLAIALLAAATGAISGGHINPAVTLAFVVAGKENLIRASLYVGAQLIGAVFGAALLDLSTPGGLVRWLGERLRGVNDPKSGLYEGEGAFVVNKLCPAIGYTSCKSLAAGGVLHGRSQHGSSGSWST
jgi:glycerol uptake facilitator-like aquaporin